MKQTTYKGIAYNVPQWAKWMAEDFNGWLIAFEEKPSYERGEWVYDGGRAQMFAQRNTVKLMEIGE